MADNKITTMINYQMTETSKNVLKAHLSELLQDEEELRAFIKEEVQKALADISLAVKLPIPE